jgi:hypothetical protein
MYMKLFCLHEIIEVQNFMCVSHGFHYDLEESTPASGVKQWHNGASSLSQYCLHEIVLLIKSFFSRCESLMKKNWGWENRQGSNRKRAKAWG